MGDVSRRDFLKGAGAFGIGAVAVGTGLAACSENDAEGGRGQTSANAEDATGWGAQVHVADVVVVGGGLAGTTAARRVLAKGLSVAIVDKGPWGHSGTSGMNWGHNAETNEWADGDGSDSLGTIAYINDGMVNQPNGLALCKAIHSGRPCATFEQAGCTLERRRDGHPAAGNAPGPLAIDNGTFNRYFCLELSRKGADVHDRTMVIDLLQDESGQAAGVVAIDLVTGSPQVFRGKAVIFATGSFRWVSGFNGMKPHTIASPENTGDGLAIMMRRGIAMRDMEEQPIDYVQWTPLGTRQSMGAMGASTINWRFIFDRDFNKLVQGEGGAGSELPEGVSVSNGQLARYYYRAQLDGRGTPNGGVYVITTDPDSDDRYYRRTRENQLKYFGYDLPEYTEVVAEQWEDAGHPFNYSPEAETEIQGLYYAASAQGAWAGTGFWGSFGSGFLSGESAAARAASAETAPAVNWDSVKTALDEAYGLLDAEPSDPLRPTVVFRKIQEAYWAGLSPLRDETGITTAIRALKGIEEDDLPRMFIPQKSRQYNTDWHRALEAKGMLMCAQATAEAALIRRECRGAHVRSDYPIQDNENFLVSTRVAFANGAWTSSLEALDDSIISLADLKAMLPVVNL
jgi:succinate dehydrogenase / fumarate reductase flavoprotein subunit